jgi:hypothetical protein
VFYSQIDFLEDLWWHHDGAQDPSLRFLPSRTSRRGHG